MPPSGTCHLISPVFRSYAVISDHGGPIAVIPFDGLSMKSYGEVYRTGPFDAASFAAAISCAFCSGVTIGTRGSATERAARSRLLVAAARGASASACSWRRRRTRRGSDRRAELPQLAPPL